MATTPGQGESLDPLTYKTSVLKVSVHCEGCKRKVKKVLLGVHGVNAVDVDIKQQKVIVNGNVDAATLIKKLEKSGKHAQLWPEIVAEKKEKKLHKSKNKEKPIDPETNTQASDDHGSPKKEKPTVKVEASKSGASPAKNSDGGGGGGAVKFEDGAAKNGGGGGSEVAESKSEGKKPETGSAGKQLPVTDKKGRDSEGGDEESNCDSDNSGKKMKNEEQKSTAEDKPSSGGGGPMSIRLENQHAGPPPPVSFIPPRHHHHGYQYPPQYYAPPSSGGAPDHYVGRPPVNLSPPRHDGYQYAVSYNTSYPTSSYTTSYYASPPPQSYAYVHPGPETEPPPSDLDSYPRQPLDSFEMFSDENPNGCFIM